MKAKVYIPFIVPAEQAIYSPIYTDLGRALYALPEVTNILFKADTFGPIPAVVINADLETDPLFNARFEQILNEFEIPFMIWSDTMGANWLIQPGSRRPIALATWPKDLQFSKDL